MRYLSLFSGIDAATVAWHPLGWVAAAFAQHDPEHRGKGLDFASAVLKHHYPDVPNLGDVTKADFDAVGLVDVIVFGSPCQSFSVAGKRLGLDDARGNLALIGGQIVYRKRPRWFIFENVPGLLSLDSGWDFGTLLASFAGYPPGAAFRPPADGWRNAGYVEQAAGGYGLAWRVLDTQFVRVDGFGRARPQRRRRVFVVGYIGDWRRAAAVLLELESLSGNPPPRRSAGQEVAGAIAASSGRRGGVGEGERGQLIPETAPTLSESSGHARPGDNIQSVGYLIPEVANPLTARMHKGVNTTMDEGQTMIGEPAFVQEAADPLVAKEGGTYTHEGSGNFRPRNVMAFSCKDYAQDAMDEASPTLRAMGNSKDSKQNGGGQVAVAFQPRFARNGRGAPDVVAAALTGEAGRTGKGDSAQCVAINGEYENGTAGEGDASSLLFGVRRAIGEEAFARWGFGILDSLQSKEILRSGLHGSEFRPAAFSRSWLVYCALSRAKNRADGALQSMCEAAGVGRPSSGWKLSEQFAGELGTYLSELSQPGAQSQRFVRDLWGASEGLGLLRATLSAVQEARRPVRREGQPAYVGWKVRRLIPEECEFLQGFPRGYTNIPWRGKNGAPDGPRYKVLGNSMSCNVMRWIGRRIEMVEEIIRELDKNKLTMAG